jgi:hypothetical protein
MMSDIATTQIKREVPVSTGTAQASPPSNDDDTATFLSRERARPMASVYRTRPYWSGRTPRWVVKYMRHHNAYLSITNYGLSINQVAEDFIRPKTMTRGTASRLPGSKLHVEYSKPDSAVLAPSYALYDQNPKTVLLEPIQAVVKVHTLVPTLFSNNFDQLQQQIDITADYIYEMEENLLFNHPTYGLLHNVHVPYKITVEEPPTPDLLDDMLSRVWVEPDLFAMHPVALEEFRYRANGLGISLEVVERCGSRFTAWRGVPIFPSNKLQLLANSKGQGAGPEYQLVDRVKGESTTQVVLMRTGEEKQGVVGLYAANNPGSKRYPQISVDFMSISDDAVASYLMTMHVAAAVLTPHALSVAQVTI